MKELNSKDYPIIVDLAEKYGIIEDSIRIFKKQSGSYGFLIKLKANTSGIEQIGFQTEVSKLFDTDGEEIDVVTREGLRKRVQQFKITPTLENKILNEAKPLKDILGINTVQIQEKADDVVTKSICTSNENYALNEIADLLSLVLNRRIIDTQHKKSLEELLFKLPESEMIFFAENIKKISAVADNIMERKSINNGHELNNHQLKLKG